MADNDADSDDARTRRPLQAAACTYRFAFGPGAGQRVLTLQGAMPRDADFEQALCANMNCFSLHAAVASLPTAAGRWSNCAATSSARRWPMNGCNAAGQVVLKLRTPWHDGTTHLVMSPLEFMQRLAALMPRPRLHLSAFMGCWRPTPRCGRWWCRKDRSSAPRPRNPLAVNRLAPMAGPRA